MKSKENIVLIVGAGFSSPAKLPIQNRILEEMIRKPGTDILSYVPEPESIKFLVSYINVGLYLLQNYTTIDCDKIISEFSELELKSKYASHFDENILSSDERKNDLLLLRETVRCSLESSNLQVSLEDVFTSFDKIYQTKEFFHNYSYQNVDEIKESITRLFVYYFGKCCKKHTYDNADYLNFCDFIKNYNNVTIISTNWDVLTEKYLQKEKINYNLCLNEKYYFDGSTKKSSAINSVNLIKLHGSINWFRCLNCGAINIVDNDDCANYLFDDELEEECKTCKQKKKEKYLQQSQIITPTMMKSLNSQLYENLWSAARNNLRYADHIYFIGYSLPMADFDLRYMLHQSIPNNAKIDVILYHDDDPNQTSLQNLKDLLPEKRYRDLFAKNELQFSYDGFGLFFKDKIINSKQQMALS